MPQLCEENSHSHRVKEVKTVLRYIVRRLLLMIPTLLGITAIVLLFVTITPGDPVRLVLGDYASEEEVEARRDELGLNDPYIVRYVNYIKNIFRGDFGISFKTRSPVITEILARYPYSLMLISISLALSLGIGIPLGIYAATHQYSWKDNTAILASLFCVSMPGFWFALMLIQLICVRLNLLPPSGVDSWKGWILPVVSGSLAFTATIARQTRSNMLEVIRQDYITTARAKGQTERKVRYNHALKNAVIPVIMIVGSIFGIAMGGSLVSEQIFSIPGLGNYTLSALQSRDYPVIQTSVLFMSTLFAIVLLLIDVVFAIVDPRIRSQFAKGKKG
jgi:peptide/nickel transport system permease protein